MKTLQRHEIPKHRRQTEHPTPRWSRAHRAVKSRRQCVFPLKNYEFQNNFYICVLGVMHLLIIRFKLQKHFPSVWYDFNKL